MIKVVVTLLILFFILTPGILWSYAKKTDKYFIALVHAAVFAFVWSFIQPRIKEGYEITSLEFKLEKKMDTPRVKKQLDKFFPDAKVTYDNTDGSNLLKVYRKGGSNERDITGAEIMDPKIKNISEFIDEVKNTTDENKKNKKKKKIN